jgi:hypothetical protein
MISKCLDPVLEHSIAALHKIFLADCWETGAICEAFSVGVLLTVFGDVISMSKWHNGVFETSLFARHHLGIFVLVATVKAEVI